MAEQKNRVLILFAHPSPERSEVNMPLYRASGNHGAVTVVDLYAEYPDYRIDIDREQQRLRDHDVVVFMFPLYWYSTPSILNKWAKKEGLRDDALRTAVDEMERGLIDADLGGHVMK